jgi:hypothetical protein
MQERRFDHCERVFRRFADEPNLVVGSSMNALLSDRCMHLSKAAFRVGEHGEQYCHREPLVRADLPMALEVYHEHKCISRISEAVELD